MNTTLLIMAAGIGSRFGTGIKQLEPVDDANHKFPVATMSKERLLEKLRTVERWKNVFEIQDAQVYLRTFSDVENIIDLFTERYTKSEVTGQEYDTSVKDKAEPISNSNIA